MRPSARRLGNLIAVETMEGLGMALDRRLPREIDGKGRTVRELLAGRKCARQ
jgi:hypothetical protein